MNHRSGLRMCRPLTLIIAIVCSAGLGGSAFAQSAPAVPAGSTTTTVFTPGTWTVTPSIGVGFSGDLDSGTTALGVAGGYVWSERVSFEGQFDVLPSSENNGLIEVGSHSWTLTANALYHFSGKTWVPYGLFGIGFGHGGADVNDTGIAGASTLNPSSTEFVADLGGGVERRINDRMGFRGDLRYQFGGNFVPNYWRLGVGVTFGLQSR
jgi:Outer membrane protein beta-barrel domain